MPLLLPSKTDLAIRQIESAESSAACAVASAIVALNNVHAIFWGQPDAILSAVLQSMLDEGTLQKKFEEHYTLAVSLNNCASVAGIPNRAVAVVGRQFEITAEGEVKLILPDATIPEIVTEQFE